MKHFLKLVLFITICIYVYCTCAHSYPTKLSRTYRRRPLQKFSSLQKKLFLWKIEHKPPSYLFGTIHVPYVTVWDSIPKSMMQAFNSSDRLYLETDNSLKTISEMRSCQLLPKGLTLADVIPYELYVQWKSHMSYLKDKISSWITIGQLKKGYTGDNIFDWLFQNW